MIENSSNADIKKNVHELTKEEHLHHYRNFLQYKLFLKKKYMERMRLHNYRKKIQQSQIQFDPDYYKISLPFSIQKHNQINETNEDTNQYISMLNYVPQEEIKKEDEEKSNEIENEYQKYLREAQEMFSQNKDSISQDVSKLDFFNLFDAFFQKQNESNNFTFPSLESLPKSTDNVRYRISYFYVELDDSTKKLLPFILKFDKCNFNCFIRNENTYIQQNEWEKAGGYKNHMKKHLYGFDGCGKTSVTDILANIHPSTETKTIFENQVNTFIDELGNKNMEFWVLDNDIVMFFYNMYLSVYDKNHIEYIDFLWNMVEDGNEKDIKNMDTYEVFLQKPFSATDEIREFDFQKSKNHELLFYSMENYGFDEKELDDFILQFRNDNRTPCYFTYNLPESFEFQHIHELIQTFKNMEKLKKRFSAKIQTATATENKLKYEDEMKSKGVFLQKGWNLKTEKPQEEDSKNIERDENWFIIKNENFPERTFDRVNSLNTSFFKETKIREQPIKPILFPYEVNAIEDKVNAIEDEGNSVKAYDPRSTPYDNFVSTESTFSNFVSTSQFGMIIYNKKTYTSEYIEINMNPNSFAEEFFRKLYESLPFYNRWFGLDFEKIDKIDLNKYDEIQKAHLRKTFQHVFHENRDSVSASLEHILAILNKPKQQTPSISVNECVELIRNHFQIDDDSQKKIRSTELTQIFIKLIQSHFQDAKEVQILNIFPDIIQELGLQKKRMSSGIFYYGIEQIVKE